MSPAQAAGQRSRGGGGGRRWRRQADGGGRGGLPAQRAAHGAASRLHGGLLLPRLTGNRGDDNRDDLLTFPLVSCRVSCVAVNAEYKHDFSFFLQENFPDAAVEQDYTFTSVKVLKHTEILCRK